MVVTIEATPAFFAGFGNLKIIASGPCSRDIPLRAHGGMTHGREFAFDDLGVRRCFQCSAGIRRKCLAILDEALDRSVVFDAQVSTALNDAVILQFLEQRFDGGLYHHDRWDCKYHPP